MYTLPLEYHVEMTWYNKEIFDKYGLSVPKTMDEWLDVCKTLKENGVTPISVDGVDRWPVQRYLAMMPFRESGNDYIINLRDGKEKMAGDEGKEAATFMKNIGQYFNDGFAATDYATAQSMFLDGNPQCTTLVIGRLQLCRTLIKLENRLFLSSNYRKRKNRCK